MAEQDRISDLEEEQAETAELLLELAARMIRLERRVQRVEAPPSAADRQPVGGPR